MVKQNFLETKKKDISDMSLQYNSDNMNRSMINHPRRERED